MPRLLIVEDEADIARDIEHVAETMGFEVVCTAKGREFQIVYLGTRPDAVVIDLTLPDVTGIELSEWLELVGPPALVVITSDLPPDAFRLLTAKAVPAGLTMVRLGKPLQTTDLVTALRTLAS